MTIKRPTALPYTRDDEADALLAGDPMALLIGFSLDQQVSVQKAFSGPLELKRRIGTLDAATIAGMAPGQLEQAFRTRPALHRFPASMAKRTRALCAAVVQTYVSEVARISRLPIYPTLPGARLRQAAGAQGRSMGASLRAQAGVQSSPEVLGSDVRRPQPAGPEQAEPQDLDEVMVAAADSGRNQRDEQPSDGAPCGQHLIRHSSRQIRAVGGVSGRARPRTDA